MTTLSYETAETGSDVARMGHTRRMAQLVMHVEGGSPRFEVQPNTEGRNPLGFEDPDQGAFVPRLGAQDLVRFGAFAETIGLRVEAFHVADYSLSRLTSEDERQVSDEILSALRKQGAKEALRLLDADLDHYVVIGLKIIDRELRAATLWRHGVFATEGHDQVLQLLSRAWGELNLS